MLMSQLSGHCDWLWHQQQNMNQGNETWGRYVKIVIFIVTYGFVMSRKKQDNVCTLMMNNLCAHLSVILVFISLTAAQLKK